MTTSQHTMPELQTPRLPARCQLVSIVLALVVVTFAPGVGHAGEPLNASAEATTPAVPPDSLPGNAFSTLVQGGVAMIPLAVCSFLVFLFIFERTIALRRGRVIPGPFVRRFLEQVAAGELDRQEAVELCRENGSPMAEIFAAVAMKWDRTSVEVEQATIDAGERVVGKLRRHLRLFHGMSTISPLLGLLGTVLGMIHSFHMIARSDAMGRPELLAGGISQALLTTAAGLIVAIPAIMAYLYFSSRVERLMTHMDQHAQELVNYVACDGFRERPARKPSKSPRAA